MKKLFPFVITLLICIIFSCSHSRKSVIDDYSAKIDSLILTFTPREFNGVILITQNGKTKYSKEYGFSNFKEQTPIKLNDNFLIQSNSKQITAVLILK
ncbi:hypothetical protein [uncultured Tenacibaculum sp.]|uniref:hypothetical protein n=1 Tax=uncultured Tenacibaculum sp. TaxID=174713 RepID=UPI003436D0D3